ncbi:MAG TPA: exodeoxyribonuclease V subunit gamma, partial [Marmoricola sp.]
SAGAIGRAPGRGAGAARSVLTIPDDPRRALGDLIEIYDTGMREPLPLPIRTAHAWAEGWRSGPDRARKMAGWRWTSDKFPGEDAAPAHVRVWGAALPLGELLAIDPMPGEDHHGTGSRLGALAARVWLPLLGAIR